MMITQDDLAIYKQKLEAEKARLMKEVGKEEKAPNFGEEGNVDIEAGADEAEELANQLSVSQTLKDRVGEINDALDRMETGRYGECTKCGQPIPKEILDLAPESSFCGDCKKNS